MEFQRAQVVVVTLPDAMALRLVVHHVRKEHPRVACRRTRPEHDRPRHARTGGRGEIAVAETEVALEMTRFTLGRLGVSGPETAAIVKGLRRRTG